MGNYDIDAFIQANKYNSIGNGKMKKTDYLDNRTLKKQCKEIRSNLSANTNQLRDTEFSVIDFVKSEKLKSEAYRELKQHMRDYVKLIKAMKKANNYDVDDLDTLIKCLGDEIFDGKKIVHIIP